MTSDGLEPGAEPAQKTVMTSTDEPPTNSGPRHDAARRAWRFGWIASAILVAIFAGLAAATRFEIFGAGFHVSFALVLGVLGTILLGVGLMALSFYSDRSGTDDGVIGMSRDEWSEDNRER